MSGQLYTVTVPEAVYLDVLQIIVAKMQKQSPGSPPPSSPPSPSNPMASRSEIYLNDWSADDLRELRLQIVHYPAASALFDMCAAQPGRRVLFDEVCETSGRSPKHSRADLAQLTRIIRKRHGKDRHWPLSWVQDGNHLNYCATEAFAKAWRAAEEEAE